MTIARVLFGLVCLAALGAMAYGQYEVRLDPRDSTATALFMAAAAAGAILFGIGQTSAPAPWQRAERASRPGRAIGTLLIVLGIAAVATGSFLLTRNWAEGFANGLQLIVLGVALMSAGLRIFDPPPASGLTWTWWEALGLVFLVAVGAYLRFHRYTDFPDAFGAHAIEEPQVGNFGWKMLNEHYRPWEFLFDDWLAAAGIWVTNDPSLLAVRIPFTIVSTLTIVPVYLVARQLGSKGAAFAATFLFSIMAWNIVYARCAHAVFPTTFLVISALAMVLAFARSGRLWSVPWMALLSGYTMWAYAGYRGTTLLVLLFLGLLCIRHLRAFRRSGDEPSRIVAARGVLRTIIAGLIVVGMAAAFVTPVLVLTLSNKAQPYYYFEAANRSLANKNYYTDDTQKFLEQRGRRIVDAAKIFMHVGDGSITFNVPWEPQLDPVTAVCFVAGLLIALFFPWRPYNLFLIAAFVFLMLGGAVFVQNLDVRRLQGVTPFVAFFAAIFFERAWQRLRDFPRWLAWGIVAAVSVPAAAYAVWWNYDVYFVRMAGNPAVRQAFKNYYTILIHFGREPAAGREILLMSDVRYFFTPSDYYWMVAKVIDGHSLPDITEMLPPRLGRSERERILAVQLPHEGEAVAKLVSAVYPGAHCWDFTEPENPHISIKACDLPRDPQPRPLTMNLRARYWIGTATDQAPNVERQEPFIGYALVPQVCWRPVPAGAGNLCTAIWEGTLQVPADGDYQFRPTVRSGATISIEIDGTAMPPKGAVHLTAGPHHFKVQGQLPRVSDTGVRLEWETPEGFEPVPFWSAGG